MRMAAWVLLLAALHAVAGAHVRRTFHPRAVDCPSTILRRSLLYPAAFRMGRRRS